MLSLVSLGGWVATAWSSKAFRTLAMAGVVIAGVWWFHSWSASVGRAECQAEHAAAEALEVNRQREVVRQAVESAEVRAAHAERRLRELSALADEARAAARGSDLTGHLCLDQETVDALRAIN